MRYQQNSDYMLDHNNISVNSNALNQKLILKVSHREYAAPKVSYRKKKKKPSHKNDWIQKIPETKP